MSQDDDLLSEGAKRIKQILKDKNIKPTDIVNALGVSKDTVSKWVQGSATPNAQSLVDLARLLGVTERWIAESKDPKKTEPVKSEKEDVSLKDASPDQLIAELKARYAALNLKAEIKVTVEPIEGGFVLKE
ncbi:helix-turn-helix domain-containing protein [Acinetobacter shaoyimingii]|uniref:Helix-turn-helix transcriptional regulator n=1 Tax=Acinetobacter shaoyimingii TaxID=2715164 RepID=A0A6G8RRZ3_9GAMM|nr:helix-turn-helix transcriptional regulator [Acinetobacter shaoyimingii]NHB56800.1 helix-turn-helix transcriptional regulator [Acinetobacter shaoyimingii]QIO04696.1 helix-turn-helix transcriptional regulator [Acinetobacter shaoyimingii]